MKTLLNLGNGIFVITEQGGVFTFTLTDSISLESGPAEGVLKAQGAGSLVLSGKQAFDLGMELLKAHSPAALVPIEQIAQSIADSTIAGL